MDSHGVLFGLTCIDHMEALHMVLLMHGLCIMRMRLHYLRTP